MTTFSPLTTAVNPNQTESAPPPPPPPSPLIPIMSLDCSNLLRHVQRAESKLPRMSRSLSSSRLFMGGVGSGAGGHQYSTPMVRTLQLPSPSPHQQPLGRENDNNNNTEDKQKQQQQLFLTAAMTKRTCSAQLVVVREENGIETESTVTEPMTVWSLVDGKQNKKKKKQKKGHVLGKGGDGHDYHDCDENDHEEEKDHERDEKEQQQQEQQQQEEIITCATLLAIPPKKDKNDKGQTRGGGEFHDDSVYSDHDYDVHSTDDDDDDGKNIHACVVLGTNRSRVLSIELIIESKVEEEEEQHVDAVQTEDSSLKPSNRQISFKLRRRCDMSDDNYADDFDDDDDDDDEEGSSFAPFEPLPLDLPSMTMGDHAGNLEDGGIIGNKLDRLDEETSSRRGGASVSSDRISLDRPSTNSIKHKLGWKLTTTEEDEKEDSVALSREEDSTVDQKRSIATDGSSRRQGSRLLRNQQKKKLIQHTFNPKGGVTSLSPFRLQQPRGGDMGGGGIHNHHSRMTMVVWVAYRDGTSVRLPQYCFFPSIFAQSLDTTEFAKYMTRTQVLVSNPQIPPPAAPASASDDFENNGLPTIVPLPRYHPTLLAPPPLAARLHHEHREDDDSDELSSNDGEDDEFYEALSYGGSTTDVNGNNNINGGGGGSSSIGVGGINRPSLSFYTSEDQLALGGSSHLGGIGGGVKMRKRGMSSEDEEYELYDVMIGATKALVKGVFGPAIGAVRWGLGSGKSKDDRSMDGSRQASTQSRFSRWMEKKTDDTPFPPMRISFPTTFPQLHDEPHVLPLGVEMHDAPRQITSVTIDPDGNLAAAADNLGRVSLIDLSTKQVVRMWKGVRDASCYWIEVIRPQAEKRWQKKKILYLVIHTRQRRVVEIWRTRNGPRVKAMSVGRDAQVIQCTSSSEQGGLARCFLIHSVTSAASLNKMESLTFEDGALSEGTERTVVHASASRLPPSHSMEGSGLRLQMLQQLLAQTNVPTSTQAVYDAFAQISALSELSKALDLLAVASHLEEGMGVDGSSFQTLAVTHCKEKLEQVLKDGDDSVCDNPHVRHLSWKIQYHMQVIDAYDALHKFEVGTYSDDEAEKENTSPRTPWAVEALSWMETYETVTGRSIDSDIENEDPAPIYFTTFAKACSDSEKGPRGPAGSTEKKRKVYFSDSRKTRTAVLVHVFRPLLKDIFVFKVVNMIFDSMGILDELAYLERYFGEWFMTLPALVAARKSMFGLWRPMLRWLQEIVLSALEDTSSYEDRFPSSVIQLGELYNFCAGAADLPRAFLLAIVCREAVSVATKQKEVKTYGQVSSDDAVKPWDELLRKLRVCLLVSLRLKDAPIGSFPITVKNVNSGEVFSVYEWIARDELLLSHKQEEVAAIEDACRTSPKSFYPSDAEGDNPSYWKLLQNSCKALVLDSDERNPLSFVSEPDKPGPLLLYLRDYNDRVMLASHRALILGSKWGQQPSALHILQDCISALKSLGGCEEKYNSIVFAARLEVWQTQIRPVYRALFFDFHDVPELSEDVMAPLCMDSGWLCRLAKLSEELLALITQTPWANGMPVLQVYRKGESGMLDSDRESGEQEPERWPLVKEDIILKRLVVRSRPFESKALEAHRAVILASQLSDDLSLLSQCVPEFSELFLRSSLYLDDIQSPCCAEEKLSFVQRAIMEKVQSAEGPIMDSFELADIEHLGTFWQIEKKYIRTQFLLAMYRAGKDTMVDELANSSSQQLDIPVFVEEGLKIACVRLDSTIATLKKVRQFRTIIGLLDADTCQWVKQQAGVKRRNTSFLLKRSSDADSEVPPISETHSFILRLLGLSSGTRNRENTEKAHALSIMSGTLVKAVQESEQEMNVS